MRRNSARIMHGETPVTWLVANFWSRTGGPFMWRNYDGPTVTAELRVLREHGMSVTRSFFLWPDFMPQPDRIDETMTARFADFLDRHAQESMGTVPTFLVGHMSGQNWDPPWRAGRDLYSDVWLVARQAWFVGQMVRRFARHPAIRGWLISNEMPLYGGADTPAATVAAWAQLLTDAVRAAGGTQPLSLGDGAWGLEVSGEDNGFRLAETARLCDFLGPHAYPTDDDRIRLNYAAAWMCELAGTFGRPVVVEEFGVSSDFCSGENAAHYYRQVLHTTLLAGASGWLAWNNTDFELSDHDPYRHHAFELRFGLTDAAGRPKPQLAETTAFAEILDATDAAHLDRAATDVALIVPAHLDTCHPFTDPRDRRALARTLSQAYVSARLADLPPGLVRENVGIDPDARLYLLPSIHQLLAPTPRRLAERAAGGACVYWSYSAGVSGTHRGPWIAGLEALFGVEHQLAYGLVNPIREDEVALRFTRDFGSLPAGSELTFRVGGNEHSRSWLPVRPRDADVVAVDGHGRPALLLRRCGAGSMVLCTYPLEHMAAVTPHVNPDGVVALYDALAVHAGVRRPVVSGDPRVAVDVMVHRDGRRFAWLVSQADETVTVTPAPAPGLRLATLNGAIAAPTVTLPPFGVTVLRLLDEHTPGRR